MHAVERGVNPGFESFLDSAFFTVSTMTSVGMAHANPMTSVGKGIAIIMMLLGTFLYVSFTGVVASTVLELELEMKEKRLEKSKIIKSSVKS